MTLPASLFSTIGDEAEETTKIDPVAQAMELRDRFARLQVVHRFWPGDLAREKPGIGPTQAKFRTVWIVIRELTDRDYDSLLKHDHVRHGIQENTCHEPDLVCAQIMSSEGVQLGTRLMSSRILEPVSDDDLSDWKLQPVTAEGG